MVYDIFAVSTAMDQKIAQLDAVTHNLANATTPGFKAEHLRSVKILEDRNMVAEPAAPQNGLIVDFSQGVPQKTRNPLDLHIQGDGFFVVQTKEGEAYTRKGDFTVNRLHQIVTQSGDTLVGEGGAITLKEGKLRVDQDGSVHVDESRVGKIKIVDFGNRQALRSIGGGLYRVEGDAGIKKVDNPHVTSGFVESSNVNIVREMAVMINIHRSFENYQKIIQTLTEMDKLSTGRLGRIT